ncbi:MAG: lysophospholipid acyltransferase family protein [Actinomycetota bacterium]
MVQPTPTATADAIRRDGKLTVRLFSLCCRFDLPESIDLREDRPTLACGNHRSLLDVFASAAFCYRAGVSCRFLVNAKYFENKIAGRWLRRIGCIPLNADTKEAAFREAKESLANFELIGIMPEGRLVPERDRVDHQVGRARPGASELANEAGAWLRPIVFHNTGRVWPRGKLPIPRPFRRPVVTMHLADFHVEPTDDPQADMDKVMAHLSTLLDELDAA